MHNAYVNGMSLYTASRTVPARALSLSRMFSYVRVTVRTRALLLVKSVVVVRLGYVRPITLLEILRQDDISKWPRGTD